ncbi:hypothetical protein ACSBR2_007596 [Camellia fascicularis]
MEMMSKNLKAPVFFSYWSIIKIHRTFLELHWSAMAGLSTFSEVLHYYNPPGSQTLRWLPVMFS